MDTVQEEKDKYEDQLVEKIRKGDHQAFEELFFEYFYDLCSFVTSMTGCRERARDIVQEVYFRIWKRRNSWQVHSSLKAYLFQSVRNEALNHIDRQKYRKDVKDQMAERSASPLQRDMHSGNNYDQDMVDQIWLIVEEMPRRRRSVFTLHRRHGLSYKEIAEVLNIRRKTVENHMGLALKDIREQINGKQTII